MHCGSIVVGDGRGSEPRGRDAVLLCAAQQLVLRKWRELCHKREKGRNRSWFVTGIERINFGCEFQNAGRLRVSLLDSAVAHVIKGGLIFRGRISAQPS